MAAWGGSFLNLPLGQTSFYLEDTTAVGLGGLAEPRSRWPAGLLEPAFGQGQPRAGASLSAVLIPVWLSEKSQRAGSTWALLRAQGKNTVQRKNLFLVQKQFCVCFLNRVLCVCVFKFYGAGITKHIKLLPAILASHRDTSLRFGCSTSNSSC